jgi:hypothetical protein
MIRAIRAGETFVSSACMLPLAPMRWEIDRLFTDAFYFRPKPNASPAEWPRVGRTLYGYSTEEFGRGAVRIGITGTKVVSRVNFTVDVWTNVLVRDHPIISFEVSGPPASVDQVAVSGYLFGDPIRWVLAGGGFDRKTVIAPGTGAPLPFGVDSIELIPVMSMANVTSVLNKRTLVHEQWNVLAAPVNVLVDDTGGPTNWAHQLVRTARKGSDKDEPSVKWTFLYRKFGQHNRYINLIVGVCVESVEPDIPLNNRDARYVTVETVFTEIQEGGAGEYARPGDGEYRPTLGIIFDTFFLRPGEDTVKSVGVMAAITILATVWAYSLFFFEED